MVRTSPSEPDIGPWWLWGDSRAPGGGPPATRDDCSTRGRHARRSDSADCRGPFGTLSGLRTTRSRRLSSPYQPDRSGQSLARMWTQYCRMTISLPDVNIWIALAAEGHVHHVPARDWFIAQEDASVAFCRIAQMGPLSPKHTHTRWSPLTQDSSGGPGSN